jgi:hypothetical protein
LEEGAGFFAGLKEFIDALAQGGVASASVVKKRRALTGRQAPGSAKNGQFAIRGIDHARGSYSALQSEKPEQKAQIEMA